MIPELNWNEIFLNNDQPMTCPRCGASTEIIFDLTHSIKQTQIHKCNSKECNSILGDGYIFVSETDFEFEDSDFSFEGI